MKKTSIAELLIIAVCVGCIFYSEYMFVVLNDVNRAIFIGLWPATILSLLNFINSKRN